MKTTEPGYGNKNGQVNLGMTDPPRPGNHPNQTTYVVHCHSCEVNYGANGCDLHNRLRPHHQNGKPGIELTNDELSRRP